MTNLEDKIGQLDEYAAGIGSAVCEMFSLAEVSPLGGQLALVYVLATTVIHNESLDEEALISLLKARINYLKEKTGHANDSTNIH